MALSRFSPKINPVGCALAKRTFCCATVAAVKVEVTLASVSVMIEYDGDVVAIYLSIYVLSEATSAARAAVVVKSLKPPEVSFHCLNTYSVTLIASRVCWSA